MEAVSLRLLLNKPHLFSLINTGFLKINLLPLHVTRILHVSTCTLSVLRLVNTEIISFFCIDVPKNGYSLPFYGFCIDMPEDGLSTGRNM
jgi:hypothetical protein